MRNFLAIALLIALVATPAVAAEDNPVMWNIVIQFNATALLVAYPTEEKCREAVKMIRPHLKKIGRADCVPLLKP